MPFDIEAARKAGKTDDEIAGYLGRTLGFDVDAAMKAGKTSTEIAEYLAMNERPSAAPQEKTLAQKAAPYVRNALEMGGMLTGGVLAAPAGPVGTVAGAGLGYGAGRQAANYYEEKVGLRQPQGMVGRLAEAAKDVPMGAAMEAGGAVLGKGAQEVGKLVANSGAGKYLYSKALKTPISEEWKRTLPTKDFTKRERAVETGLKEEILPNAVGKQKVINRIDEIGTEVKKIVDDLTQRHAVGAPYSGRTLKGGADTNVYDLTKALDEVKGKAAMSRGGAESVKEVSAIEQEVINKGGYRSRLNPSQLQTLKQEFYKDIQWDKTKPILNEKGRFTEDATKAIALRAMSRLEELAPELRYLNKTEGAYIDLQKAIEHTIARYETTNAVGLGAKIIAAAHNFGLAALEMVTGTPTFKARLGVALTKAGAVAPQTMSRMAAYAAGKAFESAQEVKNAYKAGEITRQDAATILTKDFGYE